MTEERRTARPARVRAGAERLFGLELTISLIVAAGAIWVFSSLIDAILDNDMMVKWDIAAAAWVHGRVTPSGLAIFQNITLLGSPATLVVVCIVGALWLAKGHHQRMLFTWIAAFSGSGILATVLKAAVHRVRPAFGRAYLTDNSFSFPSGHAAGIFIGIATLLFVLAKLAVLKGRWLAVATLVGAAIVLLVGVSRIYLGVHYPSDVAGGFAVSAAWMAICTGVDGVVMHYAGPSLASQSHV